MSVIKKIDGIYFQIIKVGDKEIEYEIVWHEDVGNYIYAMTQDENTNSNLNPSLTDDRHLINFKKLMDEFTQM